MNKTASIPLTRVLVLEENPQWREALAGMYRSILGYRGEVLTASDDAAAERQLRREPVGLLSLDLNLTEAGAGGGAVGDGPLLCDTGRLRLIESAAKRRWAQAVVLIARSDDESRQRFIACDVEKLDEATVSPDEYVRRRFGGRGLVLNKPERWDLATSLAHFEEVIRRRLPELSRPGYTLRFGGTVYDPRVTVRAGREAAAALEGADAMFLSLVVMAGQAGEMLSDRSVLEIYRGKGSAADASDSEATRLAQREVDGFRRRLRRHGVNDRALVLRVRKSNGSNAVGTADAKATGAWRLDGSVAIEGMSSINVRARGGREFRPDVAAPEAEE